MIVDIFARQDCPCFISVGCPHTTFQCEPALSEAKRRLCGEVVDNQRLVEKGSLKENRYSEIRSFVQAEIALR